MRWAQMWAPAIAAGVVVALAVLGVAIVSAVDFFRGLMEARRAAPGPAPDDKV